MSETGWNTALPGPVRALDELARLLEERAAEGDVEILCRGPGAPDAAAGPIRLSRTEAEATARLLRAMVAREGAI